MSPKGKRGFKFTIAEMESLPDVIEEIIPIGNPDWERVWDSHTTCYPKKERTAKLLRCKFQELARKKMPTGDPNCPPHIRSAKCIYRMIVQATDGSDGLSGDDDASDVDDDDDDNKDDDNDNVADKEEDDIGDDDNNDSLIVPHNLSFAGDAFDLAMESESGAAAITARTSTMAFLTASSEASRGKKRSGAQKGGGGGTATKKSAPKVGGGDSKEEQGITEAIADPSEVTEY